MNDTKNARKTIVANPNFEAHDCAPKAIKVANPSRTGVTHIRPVFLREQTTCSLSRSLIAMSKKNKESKGGKQRAYALRCSPKQYFLYTYKDAEEQSNIVALWYLQVCFLEIKSTVWLSVIAYIRIFEKSF